MLASNRSSLRDLTRRLRELAEASQSDDKGPERFESIKSLFLPNLFCLLLPFSLLTSLLSYFFISALHDLVYCQKELLNTFWGKGNIKISNMDGVLGPREAGRFIAETSQDIFVDMKGVAKIANLVYEKVINGSFDVTQWKNHELNPKSMDEKAVEWVFVSDVLNFSFWSYDDVPSKKYSVEYKGNIYTGYWALCAAINRALDEGMPITTPSFFASVDKATMKKIFRSSTDVEIPLLEERHKVLNEAGQTLMKKFQGCFVNVVKEANQNAQTLLRLLLNNFLSFQDVADYAGKKVGLYKRAQILIGDIWSCCEGQGLGHFEDIDSITMFADYRVPQAMVYFDAMKYSDTVMEKLNKNTLLQNGEKLEVEIRGVSIWTCELIRDAIVELLKKNKKEKDFSVNSVLVDYYLWSLRREMAEEMSRIPFYKCRCIYY